MVLWFPAMDSGLLAAGMDGRLCSNFVMVDRSRDKDRHLMAHGGMGLHENWQ
jgi:hypothetical protein